MCLFTKKETILERGTPLHLDSIFSERVKRIKSLSFKPGKYTGEQYSHKGRIHSVVNLKITVDGKVNFLSLRELLHLGEDILNMKRPGKVRAHCESKVFNSQGACNRTGVNREERSVLENV